jgi:hypothetical protein
MPSLSLLETTLLSCVRNIAPLHHQHHFHVMIRVGFARSRGFFARTRLLARPTLRDETSRETTIISHGLARKVTARPPKTTFKTYFRHNNSLIICLMQYSVLKIDLEFLARPGCETRPRSRGLVSRLVSQGLAARPNSSWVEM